MSGRETLRRAVKGLLTEAASAGAESGSRRWGRVSKNELWVRRQAHFKQTMILLGTHPKYPTLVSAD